MMLSQPAKIAIAVTVPLQFLATSFFVLRIWSRSIVSHIWALDNACILAGLIISNVMVVIAVVGACKVPLGDPDLIPSPEQVAYVLEAIYVLSLLQTLAMGIVKIGILAFYRQIFIFSVIKRTSLGLMVLITCWTIAVFLSLLFSKKHVQDQSDPTVGYTVRLDCILLTFVTVNLVLDIVTLALPLLAIRRLQMSKSKRWSTALLFILASLCVATSVARLVYAVRYTVSHAAASPVSIFNAPFIQNVLWAGTEPSVFIITSCCMNIGPLYHKEIQWRLDKIGSFCRSLVTLTRKQSISSESCGLRNPSSKNMSQPNEKLGDFEEQGAVRSEERV